MSDWISVLHDCGLPITSVNARGQAILPCPFHDDSHASFSINVTTGQWICFAGCGAGNIRRLLERLTGKRRLDIDAMLVDSSLNDVLSFEQPKDIDRTLSDVSFPKSFSFDCAYPDWIFNRGFTEQILRFFGCGVNLDSESFIIPVRDLDSRLVGWVARLSPKASQRYVDSKGLQKSRVLFAANCLTPDVKQLCITEGPLDSIWLWQHGYKSVAIFGSHMSRMQEDMVSKFPIEEVVLCLDSDSAGQKATNDTFRRLTKYYCVSKLEIPGGYKDVQDIRDSDLLNSVFKNRTLI